MVTFVHLVVDGSCGRSWSDMEDFVEIYSKCSKPGLQCIFPETDQYEDAMPCGVIYDKDDPDDVKIVERLKKEYFEVASKLDSYDKDIEKYVELYETFEEKEINNTVDQFWM